MPVSMLIAFFVASAELLLGVSAKEIEE